MKQKVNRPKRKMKDTTDGVSQPTVIPTFITGLTTATPIPPIHTMAAITPYTPITDIPTIHIIHIMDVTIIMGITGIAIIGVTTHSQSPRLAICITDGNEPKAIEGLDPVSHQCGVQIGHRRLVNLAGLPLEVHRVRGMTDPGDPEGGNNPMRRLMRITTVLALMLTCFVFGSRVGVAQIEEIAIGNTFGLGARAMGMGGAFLAVADDFTTLYWNPAGLAQIKKFELFGSLSHSKRDVETKFTRGRATEADRSKTRPNSIGLVYPLYATRGGFALALGYNRPQNFDSEVAIKGLDPSSRTVFSGLDVDETTFNSGGIGLWSFGAGVFISDNILLGGSIDFWYGSGFNELDSEAEDISNIDAGIESFAFHDIVDREYMGLGGRAGLLAFAGENVTLGATVTLPIDLEVDEVWRQQTIETLDNGEEITDANEGSILFNLERPFEFGGGVAVKFLEKRLTLAGDVQFTDWTQTEYNPQPAEDVPQNNFDRFYDSTIQIRFGAEYRIPEIETNVRVGYFRDPIPFQDKEIDSDRDFLTIGVGKIFDQVIKFDIAYMRGSWERSSNSLTENQTANRVFVSGGYRY